MRSNDVEPDGSGPAVPANAGPRLSVPFSSGGAEVARAGIEIACADRGQVLVPKRQAGGLKSAGRAADLLERVDPAGAAQMREQS